MDVFDTDTDIDIYSHIFIENTYTQIIHTGLHTLHIIHTSKQTRTYTHKHSKLQTLPCNQTPRTHNLPTSILHIFYHKREHIQTHLHTQTFISLHKKDTPTQMPKKPKGE